MSELIEFLETPPSRSPVSPFIDVLCEAQGLLSPADRDRLRALVPPETDALAHLDLKDEVAQQIRMVRAMRNSLFYPDGRPKSTTTAKDARDILTSAQSLLSLLVRLQEKIDRDDRLRRIEMACVQAVKVLPSEAQDAFFTQLEGLLEAA